MSVVKINAVTVPEGMGDDFMERFAKRAGSVESQPGFEEFLLLKPTDGSGRFFVFTRWESEEAFAEWMASNDFARAHANADGGAEGRPTGPPGVTAELLAFEVIERVAAD
ncbi:MAG: antibiotic biosynthesis monooxygenase [Actinomycetota bacterium]